eukprot:668321-Pyramimonas_sp.AAC.1
MSESARGKIATHVGVLVNGKPDSPLAMTSMAPPAAKAATNYSPGWIVVSSSLRPSCRSSLRRLASGAPL